jgi:hypothetical protein
MNIGERYNVSIFQHGGKPLQKPIFFIGECFNIESTYVEFIDIRTQRVRLVNTLSVYTSTPIEK